MIVRNVRIPYLEITYPRIESLRSQNSIASVGNVFIGGSHIKLANSAELYPFALTVRNHYLHSRFWCCSWARHFQSYMIICKGPELQASCTALFISSPAIILCPTDWTSAEHLRVLPLFNIPLTNIPACIPVQFQNFCVTSGLGWG